jgi:hypothetical protein
MPSTLLKSITPSKGQPNTVEIYPLTANPSARHTAITAAISSMLSLIVRLRLCRLCVSLDDTNTATCSNPAANAASSPFIFGTSPQ